MFDPFLTALFTTPAAAAPPAEPGTPPAIAPSSLRVWLEADQKVYNAGTTLATNGQAVSSWGPLGSTTATASANTGTAPAPTFVTNAVNTKPAVRFDSQALFFGNILSGWTAGTIFVVSKNTLDPPTNTDKAGAPVQNWGSYTHYFSHWPYSDGNVYDAFGTTDRKTVGNPTLSLASQFRYVTVRSKAALYDFRIDGTSVYSTTTNSAGFGTAPALGRGTATYSSGAVTWWVGDIFAVVACNAYLSDTDTAAMETYLSGRIGNQTPPPSDGNDTLETATDLGTLGVQTQIQHNGSVSSTDSADWYKFTVAASEGLSGNFILSNLSGNCDLYVHGPDGSEWSSSTNSGTSVENIGMYLYGGVYYVRVTNAGGAGGAYTLPIEGS